MAAKTLPKHIVLTGVPGVGKTTLILKICEDLKSKGFSLRGFYTKEERERGKRTGFSVVTMDGQSGALAKVEPEVVGQRGPRVGQYSVKLQSFEAIALPAMKTKPAEDPVGGRCVLVIDEIGKMEMFSQSFTTTVKSLLKDDVTILATIPVAKGRPIPLVEQIRSSPDVQLFTVTRENRDTLLGTIVAAILQTHGQT